MPGKRFVAEMIKKAEKAGMFKNSIVSIDKQDIKDALKGCNSAELIKFKMKDFKKGIEKELTEAKGRRINSILLHIEANKKVKDPEKIVEKLVSMLSPIADFNCSEITWSTSVTKKKTPEVTVILGKR
ncbi:MAG: hypothetical protein NT129_00385 [Candidatus Aenigmarchaeota archaeon]|nr:hypothetical protein [Candidatus Aenigmarchaeota archaeon]